MKILISNCGVKFGPNFLRSFCLAKGLAKLGNDVTLLTSQNKETRFPYKEFVDGVKIIAFPGILPQRVAKGGLDFLDTFLRILYIIYRNFDIVHADCGHRPSAGWSCWIYKLIKKGIYTCEWWENYRIKERELLKRTKKKYSWLALYFYDKWAERFDKRIANGIICLSKHLQDLCITLGIKKDKTVIIYGGADINAIKYIEKKKARKILGLSEDSFIIGYSSINDTEIVDLEPFLIAMRHLKQKFPKIIWFSTGGNLSDTIKHRFSIGEEYLELGWLNYNKYNLYLSSADLLLCLLKDNLINQARWPNKLGDYLAVGRPILVTEVGDIKIFAKKYKNLFNITDWNPKSIYENTCKVLANLDYHDKKGKWVRLLAENEFSWDIRAEEMQEFLLNILHRKHMK